MKSNLKLLSLFWKNHNLLFVICFFLIFLESIFTSLSLASLLPLLNIFLNDSQKALNFNIPFFNNVLVDFIQKEPLKILLFFSILLLLKFSSTFLRMMCSLLLGENLKREWTKKMLSNIFVQSFGKYDNIEEGHLTSNILDLPRRLQNFTVGILGYLSLLLQSLFVIIVMIFIESNILFTGIFIIAISYIFLYKPYVKLARLVGDKNIKFHQDISARVFDAIRNIRDIKILNLNRLIIKKLDHYLLQHLYLQLKTRILQSLPNYTIEFVFAIVVLSGYFYFKGQTIDDLKTILPEVIFFAIALQKLLGFAASLTSQKFKIATNWQSITLMHNLLYIGNETDENKAKIVYQAKRKTPNFTDKISLKNISYRYNKGITVFDNLNFDIPLQKAVFFIGESGSGKSTLMDIITQLRTIANGSFYVDGVNIKKYSLNDWQQNFSYISQEPNLFSGTIKENITLFNDKVPLEKIREIAIKVGIDDFIMGLDKQYDTLVARGGDTLSGGQKRRLVLIRCLLKNPKVIILDETLSSIPESAEVDIIQKLKEMIGLSIFIISHRTSAIGLADAVFEVKNGQILQKD